MKTKLLFTMLIAAILRPFRSRYAVTLSNATLDSLAGLALRDRHGTRSMFIDSTVTLPVQTRGLVYSFGADENHVKPATGGVVGTGTLPIGVSFDAPDSTLPSPGGTQLMINLLGVSGSLYGIADKAINFGDPLTVSTGDAGTLISLNVARGGLTNGQSYNLVGYALQSATAAGAEIAFLPASPGDVLTAS